MDKQHSIKTVAKLSGLQSIVIRTWENRYNAVEPARTNSNHRLYSDEDIDKLTLLKRLTDRGFKIGNIASLPIKELNNLILKDSAKGNSIPKNVIDETSNEFDKIILSCKNSIVSFDAQGLEKILGEASVNFSLPIFTEKIIFPLIEKIGNYWKDGEFRISHEHFTSAIIRKLISTLSNGFHITNSAPLLTIATPHGQYHELGALIGGALAASDGWRFTYLGISLPAEEIAFTIKQTNSKVLFLSIVYPNDDMQLMIELKKLRELLGNKIHIIVNGMSLNGYINVLSEINAKVVSDPNQFRKMLANIRELLNMESLQ